MTVSTQVKQTLATLKSARATLQCYSIQNQDAEAKAILSETVESTSKIIKDLEDRLKFLEFEEPQYKGF
jgi:Protein of unknown function (DUF1657)